MLLLIHADAFLVELIFLVREAPEMINYIVAFDYALPYFCVTD